MVRVRSGDERVLDAGFIQDALAYDLQAAFVRRAAEVETHDREFMGACLDDERGGIERIEYTVRELVVPGSVAPHRHGLARCNVTTGGTGLKSCLCPCGARRYEQDERELSQIGSHWYTSE